MIRRSLWLWALLCGGCEATGMEYGQGILLAAPLITLAGALLSAGYAKLWQPLAETLRFSWRPTLMVLVVFTALCVGIVFFPPGSGEWIGEALWFVGASYLTLQLLVLRIAVRQGSRKNYSLASLAPWSLLYPPALIFGYWGPATSEVGAFPGLVWVLPGYAGLVLVPVLCALLIEVLVRRKRLADRRKNALPEARARFRSE